MASRYVPLGRTTIAPGGGGMTTTATVSVAVTLKPPAVAVIVVSPVATPVATPVELLIVPTPVSDEANTGVTAYGTPN